MSARVFVRGRLVHASDHAAREIRGLLEALARSLKLNFFWDHGSESAHIDSPLLGRIIVIDPAHGGRDRASRGASGYFEADGTFDIARRLARFLTSAGADVVLTRSGDDTVDITERRRMAKEAGAAAYLSIHTGTPSKSIARGAAVYYGFAAPISSRRLSISLLREMGTVAGIRRRGLYLRLRRAVDGEGYGVAVPPGVPSAVIECANHGCSDEERLLLRGDFREMCAFALFRGILGFFGASLRDSDPALEHYLPVKAAPVLRTPVKTEVSATMPQAPVAMPQRPAATPPEAAPVTTPPEAAPVATPTEAAPVATPPEAAPVATPTEAAPVATPTKAAPVAATGPKAGPQPVTATPAMPQYNHIDPRRTAASMLAMEALLKDALTRKRYSINTTGAAGPPPKAKPPFG